MPPTQGPENFLTTDEIIGICIIVIGVTVCIIRLLCISRKKRKDSKNLKFHPDELPIKRTAADHLGELKEATQKVVRTLSIYSPRESHTPLDNSSLFSSSSSSQQVEKRKSSPYINSMRSSKSFSRKVEPRLKSHKISKNNSKYSSRVVSLRSSSTIKSQKRSPPTPPPSPLKFQDDIIEVDPIRMSLINTLLSNISKSTYTLPSSLKTSSRVPSKVQSRIESRIESTQSRMGSRTSSNSSISSQSISSSRPSSRISL